MNIEQLESVYFLGVGGIGMSNLARYFHSKGKKVAGYDRTESELTLRLAQEGIEIHYTEDVKVIPSYCLVKEKTLVIYTPAISSTHIEFQFFREKGFTIMKRAQVLGEITLSGKGLCFSGTHGKTTTSSMTAHILKQSDIDCNAFLGGILKNYNSNLMLSDHSPYTVIEADEFDRSFHWLRPYMAVITAIDADHLDIYGTKEEVVKSFEHFTSLVQPGGTLLIREGLQLHVESCSDVTIYHYSMNEGDFHAENICIENGSITFDFVTPNCVIRNIELGVPVKINIENGVAAMAIAWLCGVKEENIRNAMKSFQGAQRRFDIHVKREDIVYIDDYAHHPAELKACIESVRVLYPNKKIAGIFQPHLYTRTRDFASDFAKSLSLLDKVILLDIYPAREEPIPGITSQIIFDQITIEDKTLCSKDELLKLVACRDFDLLLTIGAGNIDQMIKPIQKLLEKV